MMQGRPKVAIIDPNTLSSLGLKQMLQTVMPIMTVDTYGSFLELEANHPEKYFHFFVAMSIVLEHKEFFMAQDHRTDAQPRHHVTALRVPLPVYQCSRTRTGTLTADARAACSWEG